MSSADWDRGIIALLVIIGPLFTRWWTQRAIRPVKQGVDALVSKAQSGPQEGRITPPHPGPEG